MNLMGYHPGNATWQSAAISQHPAVAILAFGKALPPYGVAQTDIGEWMAQSLGKKSATSRLLHSLHANAGIDWRHSCCPDYLLPPTTSRFAPGQPLAKAPTTAERMAIYTKEAPPLGTTAAQQALATYAEKCGAPIATVRDSISHLVVVSCTGFFAPGLDFVIARDLGLAPTVQRTLIGFMGCSAAFNGLRTAQQIVRSEPNARVLVVSVELCSLHTQPNPGREQLAAYALFADGAAACLVGQPAADEINFFQLDAFHTSTKPDTQTAMVWEIGDHGFTLRLSPQIPQHLAELAPSAVQTLFGDERPDFWAIHPGGRAIVDRLAQIFALGDADVAASREILRQYGNLSSATILFVLEELGRTLQQNAGDGQPATGVAMAFGPGLVIEMARLTYTPVAQPALATAPLAAMVAHAPMSNGRERIYG